MPSPPAPRQDKAERAASIGGPQLAAPSLQTQLASPSLRPLTRLTVIASPNSPHRHCEPQLAPPSLRTPIGVKQPRHTLPIEKSAHTRPQKSSRAVLRPASSPRAASRPIVIASRLFGGVAIQGSPPHPPCRHHRPAPKGLCLFGHATLCDRHHGQE